MLYCNLSGGFLCPVCFGLRTALVAYWEVLLAWEQGTVRSCNVSKHSWDAMGSAASAVFAGSSGSRNVFFYYYLYFLLNFGKCGVVGLFNAYNFCSSVFYNYRFWGICCFLYFSCLWTVGWFWWHIRLTMETFHIWKLQTKTSFNCYWFSHSCTLCINMKFLPLGSLFTVS